MPHYQNTGGFFVALIQKNKWLPWQREAKKKCTSTNASISNSADDVIKKETKPMDEFDTSVSMEEVIKIVNLSDVMEDYTGSVDLSNIHDDTTDCSKIVVPQGHCSEKCSSDAIVVVSEDSQRPSEDILGK